MKFFVVCAALLALAYSVEVAVKSESGELQFIDFNDPVIQELIQKLIQLKKDILCNGTIDEIIATLNLPEQIKGLVNIVKGFLCIGH